MEIFRNYLLSLTEAAPSFILGRKGDLMCAILEIVRYQQYKEK